MDWESVPLLSDVIKMVLTYVPRIALAMIALALSVVIGRLVGFILNRTIGKLGLEPAFRRTSIGRAILRSGYTPGSFFAVLGKGIIYLLGITSALNLLSIPVLTAAIQGFLEYLPNFVEGVLILVAGLIFVDWVGESIDKGSLSTVQPRLLDGLIRIPLYFIILTLALAQMKIDVTILYFFAQALSWSMAIAVGIAFGWYLKDKMGPWLDEVLRRESRKAEEPA